MKIYRVSFSMLSSMSRCPTQAWLRLRHLSAEGHDPAPLVAGTYIHKALEKWLQAAPIAECLQPLAPYREWANRYVGLETRHSYDNVVNCMTAFLNARPIADQPFEVVETEHPLEFVALRGPGWEIRVTDRSDALVRMKIDDSIYTMEHKSVFRIDQTTIESYLLDPQITTHIVANQQNGRDVKGVWVNLFELKKLPSPLNTTKCRDHKIPYNQCWPIHFRSEMFPEQRDPDQIHHWTTHQLQPLLLQFKQLCDTQDVLQVAQTGVYTGACKGFHEPCEFSTLCYNLRRDVNRLSQLPRESGVIYSGLYEE